MTRDVKFDLSATLASFGDADVKLVMIDLDSKQRVLRMVTPVSGNEKTAAFTGRLGPGTYRILATADTAVKRRHGSTFRDGGTAEFAVDFQAESVLSDDQILDNAQSGVTPLSEVWDMFYLDADALYYLISDGRLALNYLYDYTGLDDLALIDLCLFDGRRAANPWRNGPDEVYKASVMRRLLDLLPDFELYTEDGKLIYDSLNGYANQNSVLYGSTRNYVDAFGWYNADFVRYFRTNEIRLIEPEPLAANLTPEPGTIAMMLLAGGALLRRRGR